MKKRIFSTLLALCMLLCLMPTAAFAEDSAEEPPVCSCETACTAESMNKDCPVCGAEGASAENCAKYIKPADDAAAQPEEKVSDPQPEGEVSAPQPKTALTALSGEGETPAASGAVTDVSTAADLIAAIANSAVGTVKLAGDISISTSLTVKRTVTLDLNGHVLKYVSANKGSVIVVEGGGQLTIEDSNTSNLSHKFNPNGKLWVLDEASGTETVTGGVITGGTGKPIQFGSGKYVYDAYYGGGVYIAPGGQLTMTGGNIVGCSAEFGGGICIESERDGKQGQFSMSGGNIIGCSAEFGGGICIESERDGKQGQFSMSGGNIIGCSAECGGGVYVDSESNQSPFSMSGGSIIGCVASDIGGGVRASGTFKMSGQAVIRSCTVESATQSIYGGGIYVNSSSSFEMSGEAKIEYCQAISNSSKSSNGGGVYLTNNTKFTLSGNAVIQNCKADNSVTPGETYGGGVSADCMRQITLEGNAQISQCNAANGSGLYITGSLIDSSYGKLYANGGSVDGDVVLGDKDKIDGPCTITGSGGTVFKGKVTVTPDSTIEKGTFNGDVINNGTITGGTFNGEVTNNGTITGGTFSGGITGNPALVTGSGTESDPYQIGTAEGLKWFRDKVNNAKNAANNIEDTKICAELTKDIDLSGEAWAPIGIGDSFYAGTPSYSGIFDGKGHTIKNLSIDNSSAQYVGLFGYVDGGTIRNLTVSGSVKGSGHTGGIAGGAEGGTFENCANQCEVQGGTTGGIIGFASELGTLIVRDCYNVGRITTTTGYSVGGIIGQCNNDFGTIRNCYNAGTVTGTASVGAIIGIYSSDKISNCYYLEGSVTRAGYGDTVSIPKTATEFADGTVMALLKAGERDKNADPWADECKYLDAAGKTLPVFNGQGDTHEHNGDWTSNGDGTHSRRCTCNAVETEKCSGGKATCKDKAVCEICKESYGSLDPNSHTDLKHVDAKAATAAAEGNIEYWYCGDCDKYFSDAAATKEITKAATVTAKLPPKITAGDGAAVTQGEKKELTFTSDASFADFLRVELDGTTLDEKNYTKREGSTIITLNRDFVATLSVGEHTLAIVSQHGTATAKFTVKAKPAETATTQPTVTPQPTAQPTQTAQPQPTVQPVSPIPSTGDTANPALWFALLIVSGSALAATFVLRRKGNRK